MEFSFSARSFVRIETLGREEQPVAIIDNAFDTPQALVEEAATQSFSKIGPYYPGVRARLDDNFTTSLCASVESILSEAFGFEEKQWCGECFYSMVTTKPCDLMPIQRLPHYDGVETERIAVLYYLSAPEQGGTSFYRHRQTGFETVTADRFEPYKKALEADVREYGLPPARYIEDGAPLFERTKMIDAVFNRMLIYRGVNLHCSSIDNRLSLSTDPKTGRLTINAFLTPFGQVEGQK